MELCEFLTGLNDQQNRCNAREQSYGTLLETHQSLSQLNYLSFSAALTPSGDISSLIQYQ